MLLQVANEISERPDCGHFTRIANLAGGDVTSLLVDDVHQLLAGQIPLEVIEKLRADGHLEFFKVAGDVRRDYDARRRPEQAFLRKRLFPNTSNAAPAICPCVRAASSAASSTLFPRPTLMKRADCRMAPNSSVPK